MDSYFESVGQSVDMVVASYAEARLEEIYLDEKRLPVHFSAGCVYGKTVLHDDLRFMLRAADALLYKAKKTGKNSFFGEEYDRKIAETIEKKEEEAFRQG